MKNLIGKIIGLTFLTILILFVKSCNKPYRGELNKINRNKFITLNLDDEKIIEKANFNYEIKVVDKKMDLINLVKNYGVDLYEDTTGVIRKVVIRSRRYQDDIKQILLENKNYNPKENIPTTKIKCDSLEYIIDGLYNIKPEEIPSLKGGDTLDFFTFHRAIIESIWESCGKLY